jgi:hypothetical protein
MVGAVLVTKAKRLRSEEWTMRRPSIKLTMMNASMRKETEKAIGVVKNALVKVVAKRSMCYLVWAIDVGTDKSLCFA